MSTKPPVVTCTPASCAEWRAWLLAHHATAPGVWLVYYRQATGQPTLSVSEATDEALCFGWINGQGQPLDVERFQQFYGPRRPGSGWSRVNKQKIERLRADGLLAPAGLARIEATRQDGSWALLDAVEELRVPPDLAAALAARPPAADFFAHLSRTDRRNLLQWLVLARRSDTRQRRLVAIADLAARQQRPTPDSRLPTWVLPKEIVGSASYLAEVEAGLAQLRDKPALIVWGEADGAFRKPDRERLQGYFPNQRVLLLPQAKHFIQENAPDEISAAICEFAS